MNAVFNKWIDTMETTGLKFLTGKYRFYFLNMSYALKQIDFAYVTARKLVVSVTPPHDFVVGDEILVFGTTGGQYPTWTANSIKPTDPYQVITPSGGAINGHKYIQMIPSSKTVTSGSSQPSWPTTPGAHVISGGVVFKEVGLTAVSMFEGVWPITSLPEDEFSDDYFEHYPFPYTDANWAETGVVPNAYAVNLNADFVTDIVDPLGFSPASTALANKQVLAGPVLDCDNPTLDTTSIAGNGVTYKALLLAKTAELDTDPDLPLAEQIPVAIYTQSSLLPAIFPTASTVTIPISNGPSRLLAL